jgi:phosphatidylglycerophosphate synthase
MNNSQFGALVHVQYFNRTKILGLTTIERTVLALSKVGVTDIVFESEEPEDLKLHLAHFANQAQLHFIKSSKLASTFEKLKELKLDRVYVFKQPLVVDISVLEDLKKTHLTGANSGTLGGEIVLIKLGDLIENMASYEMMLIGKRTCHSFRNEEEKKEVESRLIKNLTKPTDGWVSQNLNRPISTQISRRLVNTNISVNLITLMVGVLAFVPVFFVLKGGYWNWLIGAAIYHLASVLDGVDGELARLKMSFTKLGQWLDTVFDFSSMIALLTALVISVQKPEHNQPMIIKNAGYIALLAGLGAIASIVIYNLIHKREGTFYIPYTYLSSESSWAKFVQKIKNLGKRDFYIFLFLLLAIFGLFPMALIYIAVMAAITFLLSIQTHFTKQTNK